MNNPDHVLRIKYTPLPKQKQFHESQLRFKAFIGGLGSGKSLSGVMEVLKFCLENPGARGMIVAPTYQMLTDATMDSFFQFTPPELIKQHQRGKRKVILINNSEIWYRSAENPERLRGPNIHFAFMDEAALCSRKAWEILIGRIRAPGHPNKAWIAGTPNGFNWVYDFFIKEPEENNRKNIIEIIYSSSTENKHLAKEYIESLKQSYKGSFYKQEVEGQFTASESVVYKEFNRNKHIKNGMNIDHNKWKKFIGAIDWGFTNPSVCLIAGIDGDGRIWILGEVYKRRIQIDELIEKMRSLITEVRRRIVHDVKDITFYADPSEPQNIEKLRSHGFNVQRANNEVMPGIMQVTAELAVLS